MVIVRVLSAASDELLETAINDWLIVNDHIYVDDNIDIGITGNSDTSGWTAIIRIKRLAKQTVENNKYDAGTNIGFKYS